jgi:hypothetical protein
MGNIELKYDDSESYLEKCLKLSPAERLLKSFEMPDWDSIFNKRYQTELKERLHNNYLLL